MKRIKKWKRRGSASSDGVTPRPRQSSSSLCDKHSSSRSAADLHFKGGPKASITEVSHVPDIAILDINIKPTRTATGFNVSRKGSVGNKSNLSLSTGAPTIVAHTSQTIWDEALEKLTLKQQKSLHNCNSSKPTDSTELINAVRSKQDELQTLSWDYSFKLGKRTYDVKKLMENVVTWVGRFISIGDIIVQYDPTHIALPWAGIRFLLQVSIEDKANMTAIAVVLERATNVIAICSIYIEMYLGQIHSSTELLKDVIVELYAEILRTLALSIDYFNRPHRIFKSIFDDQSFDEHLLIIDKLMLRVNEVVGAVHLEVQHSVYTFQRDTFANLHAKLEGMDNSLERINKGLGRFMEGMDSSLGRINEGLDRFMEDKIKEEFLKWLSPCPHLKHHRDAGDDILENTGKWLFEKNFEFQRWKACTGSIVLCLTGSLGVGKTKLTHAGIEVELKQLSEQRPVIYFYCSQIQEEPERVRPDIILGTLLRQLLFKTSCYPPELKHRYKERKSKGTLRIEELQHYLKAVFKEYSQTTIFIDAIDEVAAHERHKLLDVLRAFITEKSINVKIWISSRRKENIRRVFDIADEIIIDGQNKLEIRQYIKREVTKRIKDRRLLNEKVNDKLEADIINMLTEKSDGMFLWATLQIKELCKLNRPSYIKETLCRLPTDLKEAYDKMYDEILNEPLHDCQIALMALRWVMSAKRQLSPAELAHAAWLSVTLNKPESGGFGTVGEELQPSLFIKICHGFITVDKLNVRFFHPSVQEYLRSRIDFNAEAPDRVAAKTCLAYLKLPKPITGPFSKYIIEYWSAHCKLVTQKEPADASILHELLTFLCPCEAYEQWLSCVDDDAFCTGLDPLFVAVRYGLTGVYKEMLRKNQAITPRNTEDKTPLHVAAQFGHEEILILYQDLGCKDIFNDQDKNGWTPLDWAVLCNQEPVVKRLLSWQFVDANKPDHLGKFTPLTRAAWCGRSDMVRILASEPRVDIEKTDNLGMTALVWAARRGDTKVMCELLSRGANANACDNYKRTALHWALISKEMKALRLLTETPKIDLNPLDVNGMTPLFYACKYHDPKTLVSTLEILLAAKGVDINYICWSTTPLIIVAGSGHEEAVRLLVRAPGIKLNEMTLKNRTALMVATLNNRERCVQLLLSVCSEADLRHSDTSGKTALVHALEKGYDGITKHLLDKEGISIQGHRSFDDLKNITGHDVILARLGKKTTSSLRSLNPIAVRDGQFDPARSVFKLALRAVNQKNTEVRNQLLQHTDVNIQNDYGETALHIAAQNLHGLDTLNILLSKPGISLDPKDKLGKTPFIEAAKQGNVAIVRRLLSSPGVNPNACDCRGRTALWYSVRDKPQFVAIVKLLVEDSRVDINAADNQSVTPIFQAVHTKATEIASILLTTGKTNVNLTDHMGFAPLTYAAMKGPPSILELLLEVPGVDIECRDDRWYTPLALAAKYGQEESVAALIARGASLVAWTNKRLTPLQVAVECKHTRIVQLLNKASLHPKKDC